MSLNSPSQCLTFNLQRAARALARDMEAALKPAGLSAPQFATLSMLDGHGSLPISRLAAELGADRTTMTRNLAILRRRGLIESAESGDGRAHAPRLTEAGRRKLAEALPLWTAQQARDLRRVGDAGADSLLGQLRALAE